MEFCDEEKWNQSCLWHLGQHVSAFKAHTQIARITLPTQLSLCLQFVKSFQMGWFKQFKVNRTTKSTHPNSSSSQTSDGDIMEELPTARSRVSVIEGLISHRVWLWHPAIPQKEKTVNLWKYSTKLPATWNQRGTRECRGANEVRIVFVLSHGAGWQVPSERFIWAFAQF